MLHNNQQPVSPNPLEDIHVDDFSLVIIPVIILHPHFTLCFFCHVQLFWIEAKDIPLWMENTHAEKSEDNKYKQDVFKTEDARELSFL